MLLLLLLRMFNVAKEPGNEAILVILGCEPLSCELADGFPFVFLSKVRPLLPFDQPTSRALLSFSLLLYYGFSVHPNHNLPPKVQQSHPGKTGRCLALLGEVPRLGEGGESSAGRGGRRRRGVPAAEGCRWL